VRRATALLLAAALVVGACGSDDDTGAAGDGEATTESSEDFPVTIEHKFGETTVEDAPERIVAVGLTEQDALLALGIVPVGTTEWFGEHPGAIWPWAQDELDALGGEAPTVVGDATAVNFEKVAAQQPDLILAIYAGLTDADYDKLSAIAPTVAQPDDHVDYGTPWQETTRLVGRAVGKADEADDLVAGVEAQIAAAAAAHPEFEGSSALMATPFEGIYVYGPQDPRGRFLEALGFTLPPDLAEIAGEEYGGDLADERVAVLDVDAIVWLDAPVDASAPLSDVYRGLRVHTEAREVFLDSFDTAIGGATSFVSVLSLPFLLEGLVPRLALAVDGDPATAVPGPAD
jgi:iron complex transport system substrate-binding protein